MPDFLMLVNADHPLPLDWEPDGLVDLWAQQPRLASAKRVAKQGLRQHG